MRRHTRNFVGLLLLLLVLVGAALLVTILRKQPQVIFHAPQELSSASSVSSVSMLPGASSAASSSLPGSVLIDVPFQPQAPFANWDPLHEEACEEMSLMLVVHYLRNTSLTPQQAEDELQTLVAWEHAHGYANDVTTAQLGQIAKDYYHLSGNVLMDLTEESLKRTLATGRPVIVPAAGRLLGNPYFSGDGPFYHMLVLIGYDDTGFITNEVGTRRGAHYHYDYDVLLNAIHDWTGSHDTIEQGAKVGLVVHP